MTTPFTYSRNSITGGSGDGTMMSRRNFINEMGGFGPNKKKKNKSMKIINRKSKKLAKTSAYYMNTASSSSLEELLFNAVEILAAIAANTKISNDHLIGLEKVSQETAGYSKKMCGRMNKNKSEFNSILFVD